MTDKTTVSVIPVPVCGRQAPIKRMKIEDKGTHNVVVYGRDLEAVCPECKKKFKDHK